MGLRQGCRQRHRPLTSSKWFKKPLRRTEISDPIPITRDTLDLNALQKPQGHKYDHGHALVLTGGAGRTGAARLAGQAALRMGAGAVTLGVPPNALMEVACHITAAMMIRIEGPAALDAALADQRLNALCLGPGLGLRDEKRDLIEVALKSKRACVLDADACTLLARAPALFAQVHAGCILTPHAGEFARLFPDLSEQEMGRPNAVMQAAARAGCCVVLKGAQTLIATPDGSCWRHDATGPRAAPWLATAGSGDVLAGFITGLLARGFTPQRAATHAVWLHVSCALEFGPGLTAEDLSPTLPKVLQSLLG